MKFVKHRHCNQLPTKSHDELEDNSIDLCLLTLFLEKSVGSPQHRQLLVCEEMKPIYHEVKFLIKREGCLQLQLQQYE